MGADECVVARADRVQRSGELRALTRASAATLDINEHQKGATLTSTKIELRLGNSEMIRVAS